MSSDDRRRSIGKVVSVSADRFAVELYRGSDNFTVVGFDDIHYVARLGSFIVIPVRAEYIVSEVVGLREVDPTNNRPGAENGGQLDKASSSKFLDLVPVGTLPQERDGAFKFGVSQFPSLYADALYILDSELDRVFEVSGWIEPADDGSGSTRLKALTVGRSVVFENYEIKARIDEFFGGHAAVLGNTGSGKSCTVASIMQSIFEKPDEYFARGATFVVLDVNGEYRTAFSKLRSSIRRVYLRVADNPHAPSPTPSDDNEGTGVFRLPLWFLSVEEWELLLRASERTQQPVLRTALGLTSLIADVNGSELAAIKNHVLASCVRAVLIDSGTSPAAMSNRITALLTTFHTAEINMDLVRKVVVVDFGKMDHIEQLSKLMLPYILEEAHLPGYKHREFTLDHLEAAMDLALLYEEAHGNRQIRDYCAQMLTRIKWVKEREEFAFLRVRSDQLSEDERHAGTFVESLLGLNRKNEKLNKSAQIIVLDMNEAADEVVGVASAVMARLIFERLRRADPRNRFPVHFVLEEAHRYIPAHASLYAIDAGKIFERIAKEGRKYGMFLLVASQRPSELSKTVLSQCSNFVVHRILNPDDLDYIRHMTPFVSDSVMKRLPSLPKQHALIFGSAVNLPTTFRVRDANPRPKSDDAAIRELWFRPEGFEVEMNVVNVNLKQNTGTDMIEVINSIDFSTVADYDPFNED